MSTVQYRVAIAKKDERVDGPDDAEVVMSVAVADASADDFDPAVAFMRGKLKATGPSSAVLDALKSGDASRRIRALVAEV